MSRRHRASASSMQPGKVTVLLNHSTSPVNRAASSSSSGFICYQLPAEHIRHHDIVLYVCSLLGGA